MKVLSSADYRHLNWLRYMSLVGALFTMVVILVGAWTRLVDAGLGCPDWPGCYGALIVPDAGTAALHSPDSPLEVPKAWMEMFHRYLASSLGLLVTCLVLFGRRFRCLETYPWMLTLVLFVAIVLQGAFGAFTVTLKLWPQVVTLHLLGGVGLLALFMWLYLRIRACCGHPFLHHDEQHATGLGKVWWLAIVFLVLQLMLGGWTSSNYAGVACQGFPTCNTQWLPSLDWGEGFHLTQTVGPNYLHGSLHAEARTTIHYIHRLGALILLVALLFLWLRRRNQPEGPWLLVTLGVGLLQTCLGIANVLLGLPLWLALLHTAGAIALVSSMVIAIWQRCDLQTLVRGVPATQQQGGESCATPW